MKMRITFPLRALFLLAGVLAFPVPATAQLSARTPVPDWRTAAALGLLRMGGAPHALVGGTAYVIRPWLGGLGVYTDLHMSHRSWEGDGQFTSDVTVQQAGAFGDSELRSVDHWIVLNVGLIRPLTPEFAVFGGAGYARQRFYREYYDDSLTRGVGGHYRVKDDVESGNRLNLTAGAMFRFGEHINFHFGVESAPGFLVGISYLNGRR